MIQFVLGSFGQTDWDAYLRKLDGASFLQTWAWGAAKAETGAWRVERGIIQDRGRVVGAAQVMVRSLPMIGGGLAWVARAPLYTPDYSIPYVSLLESLRRHYVEERALHLRIAPALPIAKADDGTFATAGFRLTETAGWVSAIVDLALPPEILRGKLAPKWRNGLNKAERLDVSISVTDPGGGFSDFLSEYRLFLNRRGFATSVTPDLLAAVQRYLPKGSKMIAWRCSRQGEQLGSTLIVRYGDRAEYFVGTLTDAGRQYNAGQLLLWRALLSEKEAGTRWFDLGGMDPKLTPKGVLAFKTGLGGNLYSLADEIEADDGGVRARLVRWLATRARASTGAGG